MTSRALRDAVLRRFAEKKDRVVIRDREDKWVRTRLRSGIKANLVTLSRLAWAVGCGMSLRDMGR